MRPKRVSACWPDAAPGRSLMQAARYWAYARGLSTLRVATQMGNTAALKRYILSGANVESTAYWLYR